MELVISESLGTIFYSVVVFVTGALDWSGSLDLGIQVLPMESEVN